MFYFTIHFVVISIAPAADCTDDFTFNRTKYNDGERGLRHLDGFVDCEAASEGNQYYMEHHNITEETSKSLFSCFKSDGLCLTFTNLNDGVWRHTVYELYEKGNNNRLIKIISQHFTNH